jgi:hypothetical protein
VELEKPERGFPISSQKRTLPVVAIVYIEPRPKGRTEGSPIDDYVVENEADRV